MKQTYFSYNWHRLRLLLSVSIVLLLPQVLQAQSATIVISQVYGGGGSSNTAATYNQDYVELYNRSTTDQAVGGFTLQYGAATGTSSFTVTSAIPAGTVIPAGSYYLIALGTGTSGVSTGAVLPIAANFTPSSTLNLAATAGRVALVSNSTPLTGASSVNATPTLIDFVGYGSAATYEGSAPVAALSTTSAAFRGSDGCTDTNQNSSDFTTATPAPRNSSQQKTACSNQVLVVNPSVLVFSAPTGQVANTATYTLAGYNLGANATVTISSSNAAVLLSTTGRVGSFAGTANLTTTASGTLTQPITVQFTAPATAGITNATISNTDGTRTATVSVTGSAIVAYTWNGSSASYSNAASWTPARTTPGNSDVLIFDGSVTAAPTVTVDYTSSQTLGQLLFINSVAATLNTDDTRSLVLDNNLPGDDLVVGAGSAVTVASTSTTTATAGVGLNISLTSTETAAVSGTLVFAGNTGTTNGRHTLQATGAGAVQFLAGSLFRATATYSSASPFGSATANANSIIFRNGSRYEQLGGTSPFGTSTAVVSMFEPTSYFLFSVPSSSPSLTGRMYGTLAYDIPGNSSPTGGDPLTIQGDLIITNGTVSINVTGGIILQGNVQVNGTSKLSFVPASASTVQLSGTAAQTLGGNSTTSAPLVLGPNATLQVNNVAGITLGVPLTIPGTLQLTNGLLTTTIARSLTLPATATISAGSTTSFVNGPVVRPLSAAGTYVFPVGKGAAYRPISLTITAQSGTTYYRAEQFEGNPGQDVTNSTLTRVSRIRAFTISPFASAADAASATAAITQPSGFSGTATLSFGTGDYVTDPTQLVIAKRPNATSPWVNVGSGSSSGSATNGTVTSGVFTSFSDFALGTIGTDLTANPLPVVLTQFSGVRHPNGAVQISWGTASEQRSAFFEVQRSLDGRTFGFVAKAVGNGTTTQAHSYTHLDSAAPTSQLYYRLRQVDTDGSATFSHVVTLAATEAATIPAVYPNPAHDHLTINAAAGTQVQVLDLVGRVLQGAILPTSGRLSTEALLPGTYLLRLFSNGQQYTLRFTKE